MRRTILNTVTRGKRQQVFKRRNKEQQRMDVLMTNEYQREYSMMMSDDQRVYDQRVYRMSNESQWVRVKNDNGLSRHTEMKPSGIRSARE